MKPPLQPSERAQVCAPTGKTSTRADWLETNHLYGTLKGRAVRGGVISLVTQGLKFCLNITQVIILARVLSPEDFGLIAMVTAAIGMLGIFRDAGLSMATVQRERITETQVSNLFWLNLCLGLTLSCLAALLGPLISDFYGEPRLAVIAFALAPSFFIGSLCVQHEALLKRQMKYKALAIRDLLAILLGVTAGVIAALVLSLGYWSLVVLVLTTQFVTTGGTWLLCSWRPGRPRRGSGIRPLLTFGGNLTAFNFVNYISRNADNVLVGWWWGAAQLGLYTRAYSLLLQPLRQIVSPLGAVAIPTLSRLHTNPVKYRAAFSQIQEKVSLVALPLIVCLAIVADIVIPVTLGEQWVGAVSIFQWIALAGIVQVMTSSNGWLFISQDRTYDMFIWGMIGSTISVISFLIGLPWGANGVAAAYAISAAFVRVPLLVWWLGRRGCVSSTQYLAPLKRPLIISASCGLICMIIRVLFLEQSPMVELIACIGGVALLGAFIIIMNKQIRSEVWGLVKLLTGSQPVNLVG